MKKKIRFSIRFKLSIMSMVTIAIAVLSLGIYLLVTANATAYQNASSALNNVSTNAFLALKNSIDSADTSMNLLANQIGYNSDFANNIEHVSDDPVAKNKVTIALSGSDGYGDGSTIIGAMDYLLTVSAKDIKSATMYSPYVNAPILERLRPTSDSVVPYSDATYNALKEHPGNSLWFFQGDDLYVWKAVVNFGVHDTYDMKVVGYVEYGFNKANFLSSITDTKYENEGMLLYDDKGNNVLAVSSGDTSIDKSVASNVNNLTNKVSRYGSYTAISTKLEAKQWTYVTYINHNAIEENSKLNTWVAVGIIAASVVAAALVAFLLSAKEVKRIKKLSAAASSIANGDYDVRVKSVSNDEITDVSESFNSMAGKIQDALKELILQQDSISENFAIILSNKSGESGNHVKRVSEYSAILAEELGFNESDVHDIRIASMLHDVGKIMVDESILHKPGRFTDEEYKIMQQHVVYGGQLLKGVPGNIMQLGAIIAEHHHERYDGKGYAKGLVGDQIPKEAQITSVADVFDALVSKRCYKDAWTIEEAYNEMVSQSGKQFAPDVIEAFKKRFEDFKRIAEMYKE